MSLDEPRHTYCSIVVAAWLAGLSVGRVRRLLRYGLVRAPVVDERGAPLFGEAELARLRKIRRLTDDLGVNLAGADIIVRLTDELAQAREDRPGDTL
jgi:MerR family transcriptional regulator, heat shock protein HspR